MVKVSVVIPVHGVEEYVGRCAESLFSQDMAEAEFIFVDDATSDRSMDVIAEKLEKYPERKGSVRIIKHERNLGLPAARNTGLKAAKGEYVWHCDADDYLEPAALTTLYEAAKKANADFAYCDWYLAFDNSKRRMAQPACSTPEQAMKSILNGKMKYNVWNKLVRTNLYERKGITFPAGRPMGEDMTMLKALACSCIVVHCPQPLYNYVKRAGEAFTNAWSPAKVRQMVANANDAIAYLQQRFPNAYDNEIEAWKLSLKYTFLISGDRKDYQLWRELFPEVNGKAFSHKEQSLRSRVLQWSASKGLDVVPMLHYWLAYKLVYGVIYR